MERPLSALSALLPTPGVPADFAPGRISASLVLWPRPRPACAMSQRQVIQGAPAAPPHARTWGSWGSRGGGGAARGAVVARVRPGAPS